MRMRPLTDRSALGSAGRATGFALSGSALAAAQHHAVADSAISWPALAVAAVAVFVCSFPVFYAGMRRVAAAAAVAVQALLPAWLEATSTSVPAANLDDHFRLPPGWHHNSPAMTALNVLAALALAGAIYQACALPTRLTHAAAGCAREWVRRLLDALLVRLPHVARPTGPLPSPPAPPAPPPHTVLTGLLHHVVRCGP
ncbi:hypothetical protein [Actinacidiphila soli]|uniref:hypothetical protein n=1 Tax=Actinacidiphila soli TaxID=2487275 RepID=UPI000FCB18AE|nr:hypothetical protein [Actinacidiphila soli]